MISGFLEYLALALGLLDNWLGATLAAVALIFIGYRVVRRFRGSGVLR